MAMVVDSRHVLTCAHVVNVALGEPADAQNPPASNAVVQVGFPMLPASEPFPGRVIKWRAAGETPLDDIAVIRLDKDAPPEAGQALLADISGKSLDGDRLSVFGIAPGRSIGNHVDAQFMGQNTDAWIQIEGSRNAGAFVEGGYSGGAVWDNEHEAVVGMIVRRFKSDVERVAYMIPVADLQAFWPPLPFERRPLSPSFMRGWTILSAAFFLLLFAHFQAERGTEIFEPITMGGKNRLLNAFWGMHLFAFMAPIVFYMFLVFSRSRRLHPWAARVPSFGSLSAIPISSTLRRTAALTLTAFVLLPLAAQVHFIQKFESEGAVYIYPDTFGYTPSELSGCSAIKNVPLCLHSSAGRMQLVTPKGDRKGGYFDNAYHYGNHGAENGGSVTFFPILQPLVIYGLSALSLVLAGMLLFSVFSASRAGVP
ncbi:hypothetical protein X737_32140 [Mesorhizobium sp. L48C026A00]|nr:hypothetical protein X737_32140 [Mesorhizobium sp. L48C026A00]